MTLRAVVDDDDLWVGEMASFPVAGRRVLLVRTDDGLTAYEDRCPHLGVPLSAGTLLGHVLTCSAHGYSFDVRTGDGINPRRVCLRRVAVQISEGVIFVEGLDSAPAADEGPR